MIEEKSAATLLQEEAVAFHNRVRPQFSPYTYVRVEVMRSKLLSKNDYDKMLKMGYNEAVRFLQDSVYREEIDSFDMSQSGLKVIEEAFNANLMQTIVKLYSISDEDIQVVFNAYLLRYDLENVKMILRGIVAGAAAEDVAPFLYPTLRLDAGRLRELLHKKDTSAIVAMLPFMKGKVVAAKELFEIENELNKGYAEYMNDFARYLGGEARVLAGFFHEEIEGMNIRAVVRLAQEGMVDKVKYLYAPSRAVRELTMQKSIKEMIHALRKQGRTSLTGEEKDLLVRLEIDLQRRLFAKLSTLRYQPTLSVSRLIGYLLAKDIEVRNIKTLLKGIKLGVTREYLEQLLVMSL